MDDNFEDFGEYEPFYKSIRINETLIKSLNLDRIDLVHDMVNIHEHFHWLQFSSSTIGHLLSLFPVLYSKIVKNFINMPLEKRGQSNFIEKPISSQNESLFNEDELILLKVCKNDIHSITSCYNFFWKSRFVYEFENKSYEFEYDLLSAFDIYLEFFKPDIISNTSNEKYEELVYLNRNFWELSCKHPLIAVHKDIPILGYKDLIECSARIIERKHKNNIESNQIIVKESTLNNDDLFINAGYNEPLKTIKAIMPNELKSTYLDDFLLLIIHISINPSIVPFYNCTYNSKNNISDIHPGMRFIKILWYVEENYKTIKNAMLDIDLEYNIYSNLNWNNEQDHLKEFSYFYSKNIKLKNNKMPNQLTLSQFLILDYYSFIKSKAKYSELFIDFSKYLSSDEFKDIVNEIELTIQPPMLYNNKHKKYQTNLLKHNITNIFKSKSGKINDKRDTILFTYQEYIIFITIQCFYNWDYQLWNKAGDFDFSLLNTFTIDDDTKNRIIKHYCSEREIDISSPTNSII